MRYCHYMGIKKQFTSHPATVGETYLKHFKFAVRVSAALIKAGFACLVHAIYPSAFTQTASTAIRDLSVKIEERSVINPNGHVEVLDSSACSRLTESSV
jgi:hypothetical protein